jgi:hypothetical protein
MCSWKGLKNDLKEHAKAAHQERFREKSFVSLSFSDSVSIVSCYSELFTYSKQIKDGIFYAAVQLIGTSSEAAKYKCQFTLRAANGIEQISKTLLVHGYSEDFEVIFKSGICLKLHEETVKHFLRKNMLDMTVKLSRVKRKVWRVT